jgi:hypothetical protein
MPAHICATCGGPVSDRDAPLASCPICEDDRQYVGWTGQQWTTLPEMIAGGLAHLKARW